MPVLRINYDTGVRVGNRGVCEWRWAQYSQINVFNANLLDFY